MKLIDIRYDTITVPTPQMKEAFLVADYQSINFNDPVLIQLQQQTAALLGKQSSSFVPTRTFANQITMLTLMNPGQELILPEEAHCYREEGGSLGLISRVMVKGIECDSNKQISLQSFKKCIRKVKDSKCPKSTMFVIENPNNLGLLYSLEQYNQILQFATQNGLKTHLDGSRLFNAASSYGVEPKQLTKNVDTVTVSLNKGLCLPFGAIIAGSSDFIKKFKVKQQMLGGLFRKMGMYASMGLIALRTMRKQLSEDNRMAMLLAQEISKSPMMKVVYKVEINIVFFRFTDERIKIENFKAYMLSCGIKVCEDVEGVFKFMTHYYIREKQVEKILSNMKQFMLKELKLE